MYAPGFDNVPIIAAGTEWWMVNSGWWIVMVSGAHRHLSTHGAMCPSYSRRAGPESQK